MKPRQPAWWESMQGAVTVTSSDGLILEMNQAAQDLFAASGGAELIGKNVLDCHPEEARTKTEALYLAQGTLSNHYTVRKNQQTKLIHQVPWFTDGVFAGIVEISIPVPEELPHIDRDGA